jgi:single-strand DNA-binding protein
METLVGRITQDAKIGTTKDERQFVIFSIAINSTYKAKTSDEQKKVVTYVNCSYWDKYNYCQTPYKRKHC